MKVCVVNPNYYRSSGVTIAIKLIYEGVSQVGIEQYFVDCDYGNEKSDTDWMPAERNMHFALMASNPFRLLRQIASFLGWIRQEGIGVVHVHHRRLASILQPFQSIGKFVLVYTGQLTYPRSLLFSLTCPRNVTAISESVADNLKRTTRSKTVHIIRNPVEFPELCPTIPVDTVKNAAICIARLEPVKGHIHLVSAWKMLADRGFTYNLHLIGEGSLEEQLKSQVASLGLTDLVHFLGYTPNVKAFIQETLFAILVSSVEGLGIVTVEAASCGRPSLLTDVDGSRDCLPPTRNLPNGVPFSDVDALANALEYWFSHPHDVAEEGQPFFNYHKGLSGIGVIASKYAALYRSLAPAG